MKPLSADPLARHRRFIAAWCDDLASRDLLRTGRTPRADAVVVASRLMENSGSMETETETE